MATIALYNVSPFKTISIKKQCQKADSVKWLHYYQCSVAAGCGPLFPQRELSADPLNCYWRGPRLIQIEKYHW